MAHHFMCGKCRYAFEVKEGYTEYNDDPQTRDCPECKSAKGEILYIGCNSAANQIIGDYINGANSAIKSMADGKMYDSKSQYRRELKRRGLVELGNDAPTKCGEVDYKINEKELKRDIAEAIQQLGG